MEESKKYVDSNLIQTATTTANSLCKYKGVTPTTTSSISGQQKYPFCSNLAEITPKLVQYLHSGQNISLDAVKNDAVHEQVWIDGWSWDQHQRTPGIDLWYTSLWEYSKKKSMLRFLMWHLVHVAQELSDILYVIQPLDAREKCAFNEWFLLAAKRSVGKKPLHQKPPTDLF